MNFGLRNVLKISTHIFQRVLVPNNITRSICMQKFMINFEKRLVLPVNCHIYNILNVCKYSSKGKDRGKDKKKKNVKVEINSNQLSEFLDFNAFKAEMDAVVENLKQDLIENVSLRSTTGTIETLKISYESKDYELQELAQIVRKNPKTIILNMAAFPQVIPTVLKVIQTSGLNLNPQQDGTTLFIPIPKVTKEHREQLSKNAKVIYNKYKDSTRQIQHSYFRKIKAKIGISEDEAMSVRKQLTFTVEECQKKIREIYEHKVEELMGKD